MNCEFYRKDEGKKKPETKPTYCRGGIKKQKKIKKKQKKKSNVFICSHMHSQVNDLPRFPELGLPLHPHLLDLLHRLQSVLHHRAVVALGAIAFALHLESGVLNQPESGFRFGFGSGSEFRVQVWIMVGSGSEFRLGVSFKLGIEFGFGSFWVLLFQFRFRVFLQIRLPTRLALAVRISVCEL